MLLFTFTSKVKKFSMSLEMTVLRRRLIKNAIPVQNMKRNCSKYILKVLPHYFNRSILMLEVGISGLSGSLSFTSHETQVFQALFCFNI